MEQPARDQADRILYQITAVRHHPANGSQRRARLGDRPFHIGSGEGADLVLSDPGILPVHIRLFLTTAGQVMLTNLGGTGTVQINDSPLANFASIHWKPGAAVTVGAYELQLILLLLEGEGTGAVEVVRPSVITQEQAPVQPAIAPASQEKPPKPENTVVFLRPPEAQPPSPASEAPPAAIDPPPDIPEAPAEHRPEAMNVRTPVMPFAVEQPPQPGWIGDPAIDPDLNASSGPVTGSTPAHPPVSAVTLPKEWQTAGLLSVQFAHNPLILVAGERIRAPISLRNGYAHPLQLQVAATGVPESWIIPPPPLALSPGAIRTFDLILDTKAPAAAQTLVLKLRLSDPAWPNVALTLPVEMQFRADPDLVGWLEPENARENGLASLVLQNHTCAAIELFVAGHADPAVLHVHPAQSQVRLPAGQTIRLPLTFVALQRPWLWAAVHAYAITVAHEQRAPLDYPGRVRLRPRLLPFG